MPCILKEDIKKLRAAITDKGGMSVLREMNAQERINFIAQYVDMPKHTETAEWVNRQMEQKMFIPGQIQATKEWLKRLEKKGRPIKQKKAVVERILAKKDVMNPRESRRYMESVAKQIMGFEIERTDSKTLFDLSTSINELRKKLLTIKPDYEKLTREQLKKLSTDAQNARRALGEKLVEFQKKYEEISLKAQAAKLAQSGKFRKAGEAILKIAGNIKSMKASFDFSFLRQLQNTAYVNPKVFFQAMKAGYKGWFESQKGVDTMMADILTRPNALNGNYNNFGIEVGIKEEAFPESYISQLIDKGGDFGKFLNAFRRSEASFNIAIQTARADMFDWMWEQSRGEVKLLKAQNIGAAINTITGRGKATKDENVNRVLNNLLFAPKWLSSRIETLIDLRYVGQVGKMTPQGIRARAAIGNMIMIAVVTNMIKAAVWGLDDDDKRSWIEFLEGCFEPRSSEFGKITIGTTRFDITTGTAAIITLLSRIGSGKTVDLSGVKKEAKWGTVLSNFLQGKASPGVRIIHDSMSVAFGKGKDMMGRPIKWDTPENITHNILDAFAPISITSIYDTAVSGLEGEELYAAAGGVIADWIGIAANTYDTADKDIGKSSKAIKAEKQIAWATDKTPVSTKLSDNVVVFRGKSDEEIEQIRAIFAKEFGQAENRLIETEKFKSASYGERDAMLRELRKNIYGKLKKRFGENKQKRGRK